MKRQLFVFLAAVTTTAAWFSSASAQQTGIFSAPGTSGSGTVTPAPNQPPFEGIIGPTIEQSTPFWPPQPRASKGAPNVLFVMLDDVGFAQLGCYGATGIETPSIDKLAQNGLRYNNFHGTPLCSPTRIAFLTGRNHHTCALGVIAEFSAGFPGYTGRVPLSCGLLSEMLGPSGFSTSALGKWHLTPPEDANLGANRRWWPLGRGFDRYYGFLGGTTSEYEPWIAHDNHFIQPPQKPEQGYHLLTDMVGKAREFIVDVKHVAPDRPFFMYFCPGGTRAPQHVPQEWIARYKGKFDLGWDHYREETLKKQIATGICPPGTKLTAPDPSIPRWQDLNDTQRESFAFQMEVYAAFVSFIDDHIGQLTDLLEEIGQLDNTMIVLTSDNGASVEGGDNGLPNEVLFFNNVPVSLDQVTEARDGWGGPNSFPAYVEGWAWAGNTPFRRWKRDATRGGTAEPLIVHWPKGIQSKGELRNQFTHMIDVVPTVLDVLEMAVPTAINGGATPLEGVSFATTFDDADAELQREAQYFEMVGRRAIYHDSWRAYSPWEFGREITAESLADAKWMLFNIKEDFSEATDVADKHPAKLEELKRLWWIQAAKFNVLPLDGRSISRQASPRPQMTEPRTRYVYYSGGGEVGASVAANVLNRPHKITAEVEIPQQGAEGVLLAHGSRFAGYSFYVKGNRLHYTHNYIGLEEFAVTSSIDIPVGKSTLRYEFSTTGPPNFAEGKGAAGVGRLFINDRQVGEIEIPVTVPLAFALSGEGLCCGWDSLSPASSAYTDEFRFTGKIRNVVVDVGK